MMLNIAWVRPLGRKMNNPIKNQARRKTSFQHYQVNNKGVFESLRDVIGLVSAGAGIFAALLYLAGRSYAAGYFEAMNIPSYQVSFSMWEYGEVAWFPLLLYPIGMIAVTSFLMGVISRIFDLLSPVINKFVTWLKTKIKIKLPIFKLPESSLETKLWFSVAKGAGFVLLLLVLVIFTLRFVSDFGKFNGQLYVAQRSKKVEIVSPIPLPLDENNLSPISLVEHKYYVYKDLYLLTINEGRYFLFRDIDTETKKPVKVYVIQENSSLQVNLLP